MDYGQTPSTGMNQPIFENEQGVALRQPNNSFSSEPLGSEHDVRGVGNVAVSSSNESNSQPPEQVEANLPLPSTEPQSAPELGQIVNLETPPNMGQTLSKDAINTDKPLQEPQKIKTSEKLNSYAVKAVKETINKLNQDGNPHDFYAKVRGEGGLVEENLKNSYNRNIAL